MKVIEQIDLTKLDKVARILEALARMWGGKKDKMNYYSLLAKCFRQAQHAKEEGKILVAHTIFIPTEVFYAMDIVPLYLEGMGETMSRILGLEDSFQVARAAGFASEICSGHRLVNAQAIQGWLPRPDAFIWSNQVCDMTAKTGDFLMKLYDRPGFFLDRPYRHTEQAVKYYVEELKDLVSFLEEITGRKMDWARLSGIMEQTRRSTEVFREICELRKSVPSPMHNQHMIEMIIGQLMLSGSPELVSFYESVRDEIKARMKTTEGNSSSEKYRLLTFFFYPAYLWNMLDTLERKYGAVIVAEPHLSVWAEANINPSKPLESLAQKAFALDDTGPLEEHFLGKAVKDAREYRADGALYWAHIGCRQTCATIKIIKETLWKEAGIPTLVIDCDLADATSNTEDQVVSSLEQFFEQIEDNR